MSKQNNEADTGEDEGIFLSLEEPGTERSVVVEEDSGAVYAYLLHGETIMSHVWIYNSYETPDLPEWDNSPSTPLRNPRDFCGPDSIRRISPDTVIGCSWFDRGAFVYLDGVLVARVEEGTTPGWSVNATKDGPLAKSFDNSKRGVV